jgi:WD40 repeat protein
VVDVTLGDELPAPIMTPDDGLAELPSLLALPLHHYKTETSPVLRLWHACDAIELTLRLAVMLGVGEFAAAGPLPDELRVKLKQSIEEPTLGKWKAMALELLRKLPGDGAFCPALLALVEDIVVPLLDGAGDPRTPERSFSSLRNQLAHGGGMTQAVASRMLVVWGSRLRAFSASLSPLAEMRLVVRTTPGELGVLAGPSPKPRPWMAPSPQIRDRIEAFLQRGDEVAAVRGDRCLQLWPLAAFGRPAPADAEEPPAREATLQVYARRGDVRLQFTAIGSEEAAVSHGDEMALARFLDLFRVDAPSDFVAKAYTFAVPSFEAEVRKEGAKLVGRTTELDIVRKTIAETEAGVLWLAGAAGSGKSCLVARVASELLDASPTPVIVLLYRFKAGDARCSRESFLRYVLERLPSPEGDAQERNASSRSLVRALHERLAAVDSGNVFFVLDGLDEIAERDHTFARDVVLRAAENGGTWLCVGRPENGLPEAFANARAIFPEGLPKMGEGDVRAMLIERIGSRRFSLLKGDRDNGDRVSNPFIANVVEAASGLPLYVELLIRDILGNRFRALDAGEKLPPSLGAYFEELLRACRISVIEGLKPHLIATLAVAREPLPAAALSHILVHGGIVPDDKQALPSVLRSLAAVGSMVKRVQTPNAQDGFMLYHHALRQHLETSPDANGLLLLARNRLCGLAVELVGASRAPAGYLQRWVVTHLVEVGRADEAIGLLTNFARLMTRLQVLGDPGGLASLEADWLTVAAATAVVGDAAVWQAFTRGCVHILRRANEYWPSYKILLQLAVERGDDSPVTTQAEMWLAQGHCDWLWLRNARRVQNIGTNPWRAVLEGHTHSVGGALLLSDGRVLSWSPDNTLRVWDTTSGASHAVLQGHRGTVNGALLLPGGSVLSWSEDHTLRVWDATTGACRAVLKGHSGSVKGAQLLPDGRILSWSDDNTLRIWDAAMAECRAIMQGHTSSPWPQLTRRARGVDGARLLPDGRVLSWSVDHTLRVWDAATGACLAILEGHTVIYGALSMSNGSVLSWSHDHTLRLWDATSGQCRGVLEGHTNWVNGAMLLPDNGILSWSGDATLRIWDATTGECRAVLEGHEGYIYGALLHPDGSVLSWSEDHTLRVWDATTGVCLAVLEGHERSIYGAMLLADNGLLSRSGDATLRVWDVTTGKCRAVLKGHSASVNGAMFLPDGSVVSWAGDGTLRVWEEATGASLVTLESHNSWVWGVMKLPDGDVLSWSHDNTLRIWDAESGVCRLVFDGHTSSVDGAMVLPDNSLLSWSSDNTLRTWDQSSGVCLFVLEGHTNWVSRALLLPDGGVLSSSHHGDPALRIWDVITGRCRAVLEGHSGAIYGEMLLPDGDVLSYSGDHTLRIWNPSSGTCRAVLAGHSDSVLGVLLPPDGTVLSRSSDSTLRIWDAMSGVCLRIMKGHTGWVSGAMLLPDNGVLSWSHDHTLRLWDATSGQCRGVLEGHTSWVNGAMLLPDNRILSWASDATLRIWDATTGECRAVLEGHSGSINGAMLLPDGDVVSWSSDNTFWAQDDDTLRVWDVMTGVCRAVVGVNELPFHRPDLVVARLSHSTESSTSPEVRYASVGLRNAAGRKSNQVVLVNTTAALCVWESPSPCEARTIMFDGAAVVTLDSGHVFVLKLHHGACPVSLGQASSIVASAQIIL